MDDKTIDRIYVGSLESLPSVSSKIVRIFTSSTFTDTQMERNALMAEVYPKIKEYCREKHGLEFQVVDMRWGIRDEATDDHMTTELCMKEIINCQRLSMGPNFVVFLGQKFGYRPIPTYVLSSELALLRETLIEIGEETRLIDMWYRKDTNSVPPIHILQPISSILTNFLNKNEPKAQAQDQAIWWDTLGSMQKLLRKAAHKAHVDGKFSDEEKHNYFMSVTEREIINGILNVEDPKASVIGYVRILNNINLQNVKKACNYIDFLNRSLDHEAIRLLSDLRDVRVHKKLADSGSIYKRYPIEWMGREGLTAVTHGEYLYDFLGHFYISIIKLVDRAMRKEDSSEEGKFVTEILQHLNTCKSANSVFYGREESLERAEKYILGPNDKPLILYGAGGCGKTSLLSRIASESFKWLKEKRNGAVPLMLIRFLGTTPDSSSSAQLIHSLCRQISINYNLALEDIPADLIPLTAHFKNLLTIGTEARPLLLFLDSIEQLATVSGGNKLTWIPLTKMPPNCKIVISCVCEESEPEISKDFYTLRKILDGDEQFLEIGPLGENLAKFVIKQWLASGKRDVNNFQWRVVCNALELCSLPIFVKLVYGEIVRWKSYSKAQDTMLACTVMDSIFKLFDRVEFQHGPLLVSHALAYITASKCGLSESELEDLISLDDIVLDDVYQYHMPPVRRIPPLLWTRIRNDLPNYFSEREADGVSVLNWYHRQFVDAARKRYFSKEEQIFYYHSSIADYFLGIWGGGVPKPFRYTEMQRYRFNLKSRDGISDRKVPLQPLAYCGREGKISRYNLRKLGELPFHLVRSKRFTDLYDHVLFNYKWLYSKINACPLQAVLFDFEDACTFIESEDTRREIMLVADALRLSGAILLTHPKMLGPHLIARLLPEINKNPNIKKLLKQCDVEGIKDNALIPAFHSMHTPGGPLKYSLEGHPFAIFGFCVTADYRYIVSISNKFLTWDLATSDLTREISPGLEGILQGLVISPDNRYGSAFSSKNQIVLLNMLTNEFHILENPLGENESIGGLCLLNTHLIVYGAGSWVIFDVKGNLEEKVPSQYLYKPILSMRFVSLSEYFTIHWSGNMEKTSMILFSTISKTQIPQLNFHSVLEFHSSMRKIFICLEENDHTIVQLELHENEWKISRKFPENDPEQLFQVKLSPDEDFLYGTFLNGYKIWSLENDEKCIKLLLPEGIKNVAAKMLESNSLVISQNGIYALSGVRKNLYVWSMASGELLKELDAHFGRINKIQSLVVLDWNCVITASLDRTIKIWNIDNILKQVHVIDRHELPIDSISISPERNIAVSCTRNCMGLWDLQFGKLIAKLADAPLGAILTHAVISKDGKYIISSESGNVLIWDVDSESVVFKEAQWGIKQMFFILHDKAFLTVSRLNPNETKTRVSCRKIPEGQLLYEVKFPYRNFRTVCITLDQNYLVGPGYEKKDTIFVYDLSSGKLLGKIVPTYPGFKDYTNVVQVPKKDSMIALIDSEQANVLDMKSKKFVRSIQKWGGLGTKDGKFGIHSPPRGGLDLIELKKGKTIQSFIPKVAEGVFKIIGLFTKNDEFVIYYHAGRKTIRFFRTSDAKMIANYFLSSEISVIESTDDGMSLIIGTDDGCLMPLVIADPEKESVKEYLENLASRTTQEMKPRRFRKVVKNTTLLIRAFSKN